MFNFFKSRQIHNPNQSLRRFFRPLVEGLETRDLLASNVTISTDPTDNIISSTQNNTTTFFPSGSGANVAVADISAEFALGRDVVVKSGGGFGFQAGHVSTSGFGSHVFANSANRTLTIETGTNALATADVTLVGLKMGNAGNLLIHAKNNVSLSGILSANQMTVIADTGTLTMPNGGELSATSLSITAGGNIGSSTQPVRTRATNLTSDTAASDGDQFITELDGLAALDLKASDGDIVLTVNQGAVTDADPDTDINASAATILLSDTTPNDFGAEVNLIETNVGTLAINTSAGNGNQFIAEANGLSGLDFRAGTGSITLDANTKPISDDDATVDFVAASINVTAQSFGSASSHIGTSVDSLSVHTRSLSAADPNQFIDEENGLTGLDLGGTNFSADTISLVLAAGAITDTDPDVDVFAKSITIRLNDSLPKSVGTALSPISTTVNTLSVFTSAGGGNQFLEETNGLSELDLEAGAGDITLQVKTGSVIRPSNNALAAEIVADSATISLLDPAPQDLANAQLPLRVDTNTLNVMTIGGGHQYLKEIGNTSFTAGAGAGTVTLAGGTFNLVSGDAIQDTTAIEIEVGAILNLSSASETVGDLTGSGTLNFKSDGVAQTLTVLPNVQSTYNGKILGTDALDVFRMAGEGDLGIGSGASNFQGRFRVESGGLFVSGVLHAASIVDVLAGATLGGEGTVGNAHIFPGGTLNPGGDGSLPVGSLEVAGSGVGLLMDAGAILQIDIKQIPFDYFDQLIIHNSHASISEVTLKVVPADIPQLQNGDKFVIIQNSDTDGVSDVFGNRFKDLPEGSILSTNFLGSGLSATITYNDNDGNDRNVAINLSPGNLFPWHNATKPADVSDPNNPPNPDGKVFPFDAIEIVNYLNTHRGNLAVPANAAVGLPFGFLDVVADNNIFPSDAIEVINVLNARQGGEGEGRSSTETSSAASVVGPEVSGAAESSLADLIALLAQDQALEQGRRRRAV